MKSLLFGLLFCSSSIAFGQLLVGVEGGVQLTRALDERHGANIENTLSPKLGVSGLFELDRNGFLGAGVFATQYKLKYDFFSSVLKNNYLAVEVPVYYNYLFDAYRKKIGFQVGATGGYILSGRFVNSDVRNANGKDTETKGKLESGKHYKPLQLLGNVGGVVDFENGLYAKLIGGMGILKTKSQVSSGVRLYTVSVTAGYYFNY